MELNYFYKAEMPNYQDWTLDVAKLKFYGFGTEPFRPL